MTTFAQKAKENKGMTFIIAFITIATGGSAAWNAGEFIDSMHTTQAELVAYVDTSHPVSALEFSGLTESLAEEKVMSKCRWLKSEIRALKDSLYQRRRDNGDADYINSLQNDLEEMEDEYKVFNCARLLA